MKRTILLLLLFTSLTTFAHEDTYKAIEKSNVHIKIQVGFESSWELRIVESYAEIINDFIKEIDSNEKVFIQFSEDYCYTNDDLFFLAYGDFKKFIPDGFPWGYKYDMNCINSQKGINIIIKEKYFKLKTILQLLEFGLNNKDYVIEKENVSKGKRGRYVHRVIDGQNWMKYELYTEPESPCTIDSIFRNELSSLAKKYLSKKVTMNDISEALRQKRITISLQNDSVYFIDGENCILMKLPSFNSIIYDDKTSCLFLFNTNRNFYFFNKALKSNQIQYELPFETGCREILIKYNDIISKYELTKSRRIILLDENGNEMNKEWVYFDEISGVRK